MTSPVAEPNEEAVDTVARALWQYDYRGHPAQWFTLHDPEKWHYDRAWVMLAAALPLLRAQIADEIEAHRQHPPCECDVCGGLTDAARYARGVN